MTEIDFGKLRRELILIYKEFLKNPENERVRIIANEYDIKYGGLSAYNKILVKKAVSKDISNALDNLSTIYQYDFGLIDNQKIIQSAKKILKDLKKSNKK